MDTSRFRVGLAEPWVFVAFLTFLLAALPPPAKAQERGRQASAMLEEVIVTARRREESLQDTPIAVTALSAEALRDRGITNIRELTKSVPSLQISDGQSNQIYIRGIGERTGFVRVDPTVGVYLDDLFIPRTDGQLLDTVDVQNIQVLRGPQGTLFGKNTTGGAMVLSLAKPGPDFEGYVEAGVGNYKTRTAKAAVNVPLTDNFFVRVAANTVDDEGFLEDVSGQRSNSNERQSVAFQTRWDINNEMSLDTLAFYGRINERFAGINCRIANEDALFMRGLYAMWSGDTDPSNPTAYRENCEANSREVLGDLKTNMGNSNRNLDNDLTTRLLGITYNWQINNDLGFKAVLGYQDAERGPIMSSDNDGGPALFSESLKPRDSDRESISLEFQLNGSLFDGRVNYTAGLFAMRETNDEPFLLLTGIAGVDATTLAALAGGSAPDQPPPGGTIPFVGILSGPIVDSQFDLENQTLAAFFQGSWDITEDLQLTLGLRQTEETRESNLVTTEADKDAIAATIFAHPLFGPGVEGLHPFLGPWALDPVSIAAGLFPDTNGDGIPNFPMDTANPRRDHRKETFRQFTPMLSLSYNLPRQLLGDGAIDSAMVYATWSNGFKSGFFEPRLTDGLQRVAPETVENREVGLKIDAFQRSLRFNAAAYSMVFDDMQLINVTTDSQGNLAVIFQNAGKAKIEGAELELTWLPLPGLMANLSFSHNRYTFVKFEDRDLLILATEGREQAVDRTDETFPVSPETTASLGLQYMWNTDFGIFTPRIDFSYKSDIFLGLDKGSYQAFKKDVDLAGQPAFTLVDVRLGWMNLNENLSIAAFVKNLTDERYLVGTAAVADSVGTFNQAYGNPRRFGVEARITF